MHPATATLLVGLGGFAGACARWGLGSAILRGAERVGFPYPTFVVNMLGCLAIGIAFELFDTNAPMRLLVVVGFLGGFTTFSTFGLETLDLLRTGAVLTAALYVGLSATLGVVLVWIGMRIAG